MANIGPEIAVLRTNVDDWCDRVDQMLQSGAISQDSPVAAELYSAERALGTLRRILARAADVA